MTLSRLFTPAAVAVAFALGLGAPTDAQAARVAVKVAPVKVGVQVGPVNISGVVGKRVVAPPPRVATPAAVWVAAHHTYDARLRRMVYVPAGYKVPPRAGMTWVAGHWAGQGRSRRWVSGQWR